MYLGDGASPLPDNLAHREAYFRRHKIDPRRVISAGLVHGTEVAVVENVRTKFFPGVDALVTRKPGVFLSLTAADCVPVYLWDGEAGVVGLAHAGWRGVAAHIATKTLGALVGLGARPERLAASFGPGIGVCHFEVGEDVAETFESYPDAVERREDGTFVDLKKILRIQLEHAGLSPLRTADDARCTYCHPELFFSYRRDRPDPLETMVAVIGRRA